MLYKNFIYYEIYPETYEKASTIDRFEKQLMIEHYSKQTIRSYTSSLKLFLEYVQKLKADKIGEREIRNYLYHCAKNKNYSFSAMKHTIASIRYLYIKVLRKPVPNALEIDLRKPQKLPLVLSNEEIQRIIKVTENLKRNAQLCNTLA